MEDLLAKKLVLREGTGNSLRYTLTADARPLAQVLLFCQSEQSFDYNSRNAPSFVKQLNH